jgi:hypothetical protein
MKASTVEYRVERNTRFASEKGRYNCEVFVDGAYFVDAPGDSAGEARRSAARKVDQAVKAGRLVINA